MFQHNELCKELESSLSREQQAQNILHQQNEQLEELSQKLIEYSNHDDAIINLKEVNKSLNELYTVILI